MNSQQFTNARVHDLLVEDLNRVVQSMHTTRVMLNSAALWWFCTKVDAQQRAEILGEYVKILSMNASGDVPGIPTSDDSDDADRDADDQEPAASLPAASRARGSAGSAKGKAAPAKSGKKPGRKPKAGS